MFRLRFSCFFQAEDHFLDSLFRVCGKGCFRNQISMLSPSSRMLQKRTPSASAYFFIRQADSNPLATKCMGTSQPTLNVR